MTDIVKKLRGMGRGRKDGPWAACHEAADEIERLRAENRAMIETLERYREKPE